MENIHTQSGNFKTYPHGNSSFPTDGFHRVAAQLVVDSVGFDELTEWEQKFACDIAGNGYQTINDKQWGVLGRLLATVSKVERRKAGVRS